MQRSGVRSSPGESFFSPLSGQLFVNINNYNKLLLFTIIIYYYNYNYFFVTTYNGSLMHMCTDYNYTDAVC